MAYDTDASNRLAAVRAAIALALNAQQYDAGSVRSVRRPDLATLFAMEKQLMAEISAGDGSFKIGVRVPAS